MRKILFELKMILEESNFKQIKLTENCQCTANCNSNNDLIYFIDPDYVTQSHSFYYELH
jgi:hypothetical protein